MFINEVEHIVGLSKKSIRYYEENGLLTPKRNGQNDYREYDEEDIQKLKVIKFLRELDVPIKDLKKLHDNSLSLQDCMNDRIQKIQEQEEKYGSVKMMCMEISNSKDHFNTIDITKYFHKMNTLNKEGFTMRDVKTNHTRKIAGAIMSSIAFSIFFIFLIGIVSYFQFTEADKIPWLVYWILVLILSLPVVGIGTNLVKRIKEIQKGEEDEASKY